MGNIFNVRISAVIKAFCVILAGFVLSGCTMQEAQTVNETQTISDEEEAVSQESTDAVFCISSDAHFTTKKGISSAIIPMMEHNVEIMQTLADEVIDIHPDAFIMAGDNTNSGSPDEAEAFAQILRRIKDAGIKIVMAPGNHDFDQANAAAYRKAYYDLFDISSEAPDSLSYLTEVQDVWLFAMDDSSAGNVPKYSEDTMKWLEEKLKEGKKKNKKMILISHHSLLTGDDNGERSSYRVNNKGLRDLLISYDVRLFLSGHQHSQYIMKYKNCSEIISMMPVMWPHYFGILEIKGDSGEYHAESIDFEKYGEAWGLKEIQGADASWYTNLGDELMGKSDYDEKTREGVNDLLARFFMYHSQAVLSEHTDEILNDPYYKEMTQVIADTNYGPWVESLLHDSLYPGNQLSINFARQ